MKTTVEVLVEARALVDTPQRWGKWYLEGEKGGPMCALGALTQVLGFAIRPGVYPSLDAHAATAALIAALGKDLPTANRADIVWSFNDDPSTTHVDVLAMFDRAIANERAKAQEFDVPECMTSGFSDHIEAAERSLRVPA